MKMSGTMTKEEMKGIVETIDAAIADCEALQTSLELTETENPITDTLYHLRHARTAASGGWFALAREEEYKDSDDDFLGELFGGKK